MEKLFNETCVEAHVYLCALFPVRNKAPLCVNDTAYL